MRFQSLIYLAGLLLVNACSSDPELSLDLSKLNSIEPNDDQTNGFTVNGFTVNGFTVNGFTVNGFTVNGTSTTTSPQSTPHRVNDLASVRFDTLTLHGRALPDARLSQSTIEAESQGSVLSGAQLIGAQLGGKLLDGMSLPLRIEDVKVESGITLYSVSILSDAGPMPLCGTAEGSPVPAIAVEGYWDKSASHVNDDHSFTFGCINAAIGKCARWGYKPWDTASECRNNSCRTRKLKDWHQACVRLVRADYCGDGVSHTRAGTRINVYDQLGIQQSANPGWEIESEWLSDGATCLNHTRWVQADSSWTESDLSYVQRVCPERLSSAKGSRCDADKSTYNTQFGFNRSTSERPLIRNDSPQYQ